MMKKLALMITAATMIALVSCKKEEESTYKDGTYRAQMAEFSHGWKDFMVVTIVDDAQTSVDFDAMNEEDTTLLKSETTFEEYPMDPHPTVWIPQLEAQFMAVDILNYEGVDGITGATSASQDADALFGLILEAAKTGDTSTQILSGK
jgi:major membrane immunogen (membrane-anchored lipoprotein)